MVISFFSSSVETFFFHFEFFFLATFLFIILNILFNFKWLVTWIYIFTHFYPPLWVYSVCIVIFMIFCLLFDGMFGMNKKKINCLKGCIYVQNMFYLLRNIFIKTFLMETIFINASVSQAILTLLEFI